MVFVLTEHLFKMCEAIKYCKIVYPCVSSTKTICAVLPVKDELLVNGMKDTFVL